MERIEQPCLVPDFSGIVTSSLHLSWCCLWGFCKLPLLSWSISLLFTVSPGLLSWSGVGCFQRPFLCLMRWSCGFCLSVCLCKLHVLIYICWTTCMSEKKSTWFGHGGWPSKKTKKKERKVVGFSLQVFCWLFYIYVYERNWSTILLCWVFLWIRHWGNFIKITGQCSFCFQLAEYWY